jgi:TPR repeat protein
MSNHPEQRSQTSQSHRRGEEPRPHTSQGHRRPDPQVSSPGLRSPHPMSPIDQTPAVRNDPNRAMPDQRSFSDGQAPVRPSLNPLPSDRPPASFQGELPTRLQPSQRSMTMPEEGHTGMVKRKLHKNQNAYTVNQGGPQEPYNYVPTPISPVPVPPVAQETHHAPNRNALISPEMPNFDAISPSATEKTEDPLHVRTNDAKPAYQKATYQAPVTVTSLTRSHSQPDITHAGSSQPDFAGFTFDLPTGNSNTSHTNQQQFPAGSNQVSPRSYDPRNPVTGPANQPRSQSRAEQHPPRSASRQGYQQPRPTSNAERYGSPNMQHQAQYRSASEAQHYAPRSQSRSNNRDPAYDYGQADYSAQQGRPSDPTVRYNQRPSQDAQRFYQEQRQHPAQINTQQDTFEPLYQQRSHTPSSAHPTPTRQYHSRNTSTPVNPDALPAHPVPVRPGLLQNSSTAPIVEGTKTTYQAPASNLGLAPRTSQEEKPVPITAYDLNLLLQTIKNNPNDKKTALTLAKKLVEAASVLSNEGGKADAKTTQKNRERYIFDAHKYLKKLVHQGYPDAMFYLAECHGQGSIGLQVDPKEAFNLYTSAAKAGHAQAAYRVAVCCEMGNEEGGGTRRDPLKAMQWYKRAASMGDTPAMYKLGIILLKGLLGQPRNPREALSWLKRAAEKADKENPHALHELGLLYENAAPSDAIVKDENYSRQLFTQAAELGYKFSQFRLGSAFEYATLGCPIDPRQSIAWYTKAAAQGEHQAELALSGWYLTGSDGILQQSDTEAYLWARKAACSGLAKAEYAMGYFNEVGIGCPANLEEAKKWYWRAACE